MKGSAHQPTSDAIQMLLSKGNRLFSELLQVEERLRELLIKGEARKIMGVEDYRINLHKQIASLEEKRRALIPHGTGIGSYIKSVFDKSEQHEMLEKLESIQDKLKQIRVLQEVNRCILQERLRFSRELQDLLHQLHHQKEIYDDRGQLQLFQNGTAINLDRNC